VDVALLIGTFVALYAVAEVALRIARFAKDRSSGNQTSINAPVPQSTISMAGNPSR
jgi:hypothetical protein